MILDEVSTSFKNNILEHHLNETGYLNFAV